MLKSFTRNYEDNSTEAGFQFTFYCDLCQNGFKSTFIESTTYSKGSGLRNLSNGARAVGGLFGGKIANITNNIGWSGSVLSERFDDRSPEWQREHEAAFNRAQDEARRHFHRCENCRQWVCDDDFNEEEGLCTSCAPRQNIAVARAKSEAMQRNIDEAAATATVWKGSLESKTTVCPQCGKPAGAGKFCNECGAPLSLNQCPQCGAKVALGVKFCNECGYNLQKPQLTNCPNCGAELAPDIKFCGGCGTKVR